MCRRFALLAGIALWALSAALATPGAGVVVADDPLAAEAGARVLRDGGNAIDAVVATAFALAVTYPQAGNLGGGGFLIWRGPDGSSGALDFRERAPRRAHRDMFLDADGRPDPERSRSGPLSVGVPGSVSGLLLALERHGTLPRQRVMEDALRLARDGFPVPEGLAESLAEKHDRLTADPYTAKIFTRSRRPLRAGEILRQPDLARTLRRISDEGEAGFYLGRTAELLAAHMERAGGWIDLEDLQNYRPVERAPLRGRYRGYEILTMPPPSSGGVAVVQILQILAGFDLATEGPTAPGTVHRLAGAMQMAFADRFLHLGDPDFVDVPLQRLTSLAYADELRRSIPPDRALPASALGVARLPGAEPVETTHIAVIDGDGGAASLTTTINSSFGSGVAARGLGFLLNNEMDDFSAAPGQANLYGLMEGEANAVQPGKRMASSMSPTIVLADDQPVLVLGSPGGPRIPTAVVQVVLNVLEHGMPLEEAVAAPRVHHQWMPDLLRAEPGALPARTEAALRRMGYTLDEIVAVGNVMAIHRDPVTGEVEGVADPRRYGTAILVPAETPAAGAAP